MGLVATLGCLLTGPCGAPPAAEEPSFDCARAGSWAEQAICASDELADLDRAVAARYAGLLAEIRSRPLREAIERDQRAWLSTRDACESATDAGDCIRDHLQERRLQLDLDRLAWLGPRLVEPPRLGCHLAATSQVELGRCERELEGHVSRTLALAVEPAAADMAELDQISAADLGAEASFRAAQDAYERYRDAHCRAVAASFASGSGAGLAQLGCRTRMDWQRAGKIADHHLLQPAHWSELLDQLSGPIQSCLDRLGPGGDPRVTGVRELDDGSLVMRIALGESRRECALAVTGSISSLAEVAGDDVWPGEGDALFHPLGSRFGPSGETLPPVDPCAEAAWFRARDGDLAGWIVRQLCW